MAGKKGLGTGLNALFGEAERDESQEIQMLPISRVEPREAQPRTNFDEASLQELAESIREYGLIQAITVRRLSSGYYQIIAGERRWRAARMAGLTEVPVRVLDADDRRVSELALVENLQREDLNPIEEARGLRALMTDYGMTQEEAAQSVGKSRSAVANSLRLLNLCPYVSELLEQGLLSTGHAKCLLAIGDSAAQEAAEASRRAEGRLRSRDGERSRAGARPPREDSRRAQKGTHRARILQCRRQGSPDKRAYTPGQAVVYTIHNILNNRE